MKTTIKGMIQGRISLHMQQGLAILTMANADGELVMALDEFQVGMLMTSLEQIGDRMTRDREAAANRGSNVKPFQFAEQHKKVAA